MTPITLLSYGIAFFVPFLVVWLIRKFDVFETGSHRNILTAFSWGATGAIGLAYVVNNAVVKEIGFDALSNLGAPIIEEIFKAFVLVALIYLPSFRYFIDGAVYGFAAGIGFAMSENLFLYLPNAGDAVLVGAVSRVLSASLMHAAACALVGIALGRLRRVTDKRKMGLPVVGIGVAITLHVIYNNIVNIDALQGMLLLLIAIGMGLGSGVMIATLIGQGLNEEKERFREVLGLEAGVSTGERKAVQRLGGAGAEQIFSALGEGFGDENISLIRKLLIKQGNIGILQNNLSVPASDRLRRAWEKEIADLETEVIEIRSRLGPYIKIYLDGVFPSDDDAFHSTMGEDIGAYDDTLVHTFDLFMRVSELAQGFTPEQIADLAERLQQIGIFERVSLANLENLSRAISISNYNDGDTLFSKGDDGDVMYMIETGYINIYTEDQDGNEKLLRVFEAGEVVGEFSLLDGQPRSAGARANRSLTVLVLKRLLFEKFVHSRPQVIMAMLQYLSEKMRYTTDAVTTSIESATKIAQGDYSALPELAGAPTSAEKAGIPLTLEPETFSEETPKIVGGMFGRLARVLEQREQEQPRLDQIE